jgi:hypothetical protein
MADEHPYSAVEIRILHLLLDMREKHGGTATATRILEDARRIHDERILQLIERTTRAESALSFLRDMIDRNYTDLRATTDRHATDLNGLGRVAHTTVSFGQLGLALIAGGLLTALVIHFLK